MIVVRMPFAVAALPILLALAGPAAAADPQAPPPVIGAAAERFELANGLEVVVIPDRRAPVVTHMVWYKVGSADEEEGKSGLAHFLEHLMFKGTSTHPAGAFGAAVESVGGVENAFTTADYTGYFQRVAREHLATMMAFEADRMANLVLTEAVVAPERLVVLEERAQRLESEPAARLSADMDAVLYLRHPYGVPVIGWREEIERLSAADAIAFYDRWYTPNNAILVVAGDVGPGEVRAMAEQTYGRLPRRAEPPARIRPAARELDSPREVSRADPRVTVESLRLSWLAPSYRTAEPGRAEALDVLVEAIGGDSSARLYRDLVVERRIATSVGLGYRSDAWDQGEISASLVPREGVSLEDGRAALLEAIDRAVAGLTEEDVDRAKRRLVAATIYAQDSQQTMARIFGSSLATGESVEDVQTWPARISAVTLAEVLAAAVEFDPDTVVTGYLRTADPEQRT